MTATGNDPQKWRAYKDGQSLSCTPDKSQFESPFHADLIGAHAVKSSSSQSTSADKSKYRFYGDFDDIRIWDTVRTAAEIKKSMARGTRLPSGVAHLQHQISFDDGTAADSGAAGSANFTELVGDAHVYCS